MKRELASYVELSNKVGSLLTLTELDTSRKKTDRVSNPIVSHVLEQASAAMGIMMRTMDITKPVVNLDVMNDDVLSDDK